MVLAPGDKGSVQWHLGGMLGSEQQECPLQSLRASILEGHLELLLDLDAALVTTPCRAQLSLSMKCLGPLLTIPRG